MSFSPDVVIEFKQYEKWYGKINAVKSLDLTIKSGETFALLGPNGSGKSTIIRALAGLQFPTGGKVLVQGSEIGKKAKNHKRLISYMPQRITIPGNLTAREVVSLFAKIKKVPPGRVDEILDYVQLSNDADRFVKEYSGGMVQRIGLAITFLQEADIFLLDEPTLNLDPFGMKRLRELILQLKQKGKTFVFASHLLEDAVQLADRVGILVEGVMKEITTIPKFNESIAMETAVRVKLSNLLPDLPIILEATQAESFSANGQNFSFKAKPSLRLSIIRAVEAGGGIVEEIHTDQPNWDALLERQFNNNEKN